MGLSFPRKMLATCAANRPSTAPLASITCHLRWSKFTFGKCVFIQIPIKGRLKLPKKRSKSTVFCGILGEEGEDSRQRQTVGRGASPSERITQSCSPECLHTS